LLADELRGDRSPAECPETDHDRVVFVSTTKHRYFEIAVRSSCRVRPFRFRRAPSSRDPRGRLFRSDGIQSNSDVAQMKALVRWVAGSKPDRDRADARTGQRESVRTVLFPARGVQEGYRNAAAPNSICPGGARLGPPRRRGRWPHVQLILRFGRLHRFAFKADDNFKIFGNFRFSGVALR